MFKASEALLAATVSICAIGTAVNQVEAATADSAIFQPRSVAQLLEPVPGAATLLMKIDADSGNATARRRPAAERRSYRHHHHWYRNPCDGDNPPPYCKTTPMTDARGADNACS